MKAGQRRSKARSGSSDMRKLPLCRMAGEGFSFAFFREKRYNEYQIPCKEEIFQKALDCKAP